MTISAHGLARRTLGPTSLWVFGVSASAPLVVLAGGVTATYATGTRAVPLTFVILGAAIGLAAVGMTAMVRDTPPHAATFAALLTHGLGRGAGVAGAAVALLSYSAIQISLYGLLGATTASLLGGAWWAWALLAWTVTAAAGIAHLHTNVLAVAVVLIAELVLISILTVGAFTSPADSATIWVPVDPGALFNPGLGSVLALGIAAFVGAESVTAFGEETRSRAGIAAAMTAVVVALSVLYLIASWALAVAVGPAGIVEASRTQGAQLPISVLNDRFGPVMAGFGWVLIIVTILGAMLAFHAVVARYLYALGREGVLSTRLTTIRVSASGRGGIPVTGSLTQSLLALAVIGASAIGGLDPMTLFVQLSTLAAIGVMTLLIGVCIATIAYYRTGYRTRHHTVAGVGAISLAVTPWQRLHAPLLGMAAMTTVLAVTITSIDTTTGAPLARWLLPGVIAAVALAGAGWAGWMRRHRFDRWIGIGRGQPAPLAVIDENLRDREL